MGVRSRKRFRQPPAPRALPLLSLPYPYVAHACRACVRLLEPGLAERGCLPPDPPAPPGIADRPLASGTSTTESRQSTIGNPPAVLLVVPENDPLTHFLEDHFAQAGWRVALAHDPERAAGTLHERQARLAILDFGLPNAQSLLDSIKLGAATNAMPTMALFPRGHDPERPDALRIQAEVELKEPVELARLLAVAQTQMARASHCGKGEGAAAEFHLRFILPSTQDDLDRATDLATVLLRHSGLDATSQNRLLAAFREAINNAIQHGNRRDPRKMVRAEYHQDDSQVTIVVEDEGDGFDHHHFLRQAVEKEAVDAARRRHEEGGQGGLGILMIQRCTDHIEFNHAGNVLTFTKLIETPGAAENDDAAGGSGPPNG